jgi:hypothetical protein
MSDTCNAETPLPRPLRSQLEAILKRDAQANNIAIVWSNLADFADAQHSYEVAGVVVHVVSCMSELAMRYALLHTPADDSRLVLLIESELSNIADDIRARLWRHQVRRVDAWQTLLERLDLRAIDPKLTKMGKTWFPDALLEVWPGIEQDISVGDVLDHDTGWSALARGWLGFSAAQLDVDTLFAWSIDSPSDINPPAGMFDNIESWLTPRLSEMSSVVVAALRAERTSKEDTSYTALALAVRELLPLGLVVNLVQTTHKKQDHSASLVRLQERYLGGVQPDTKAMNAFGEAAVRFSRRLLSQTGTASNAGMQQALARAQKILFSLDVSALAIHSDLLPSGYQQRIAHLATALNAHIKESTARNWESVESSLESVNRHLLAESKDQKQRVMIPVALARWLRNSAREFSGQTNVFEIIRNYRNDGGYVDFARDRLWRGDNEKALADTFEQLLAQAQEHLQNANKNLSEDIDRFARGDKLPADLIYIENAISKVVAPIARQHPVLLLVMDGMSQAVWRELADNFFHSSWEEYTPRQSQDSKASTMGCSLIAAFPSVTRVCRHALFTGQLTDGNSQDEKRGFANHADLVTITGKTTPPVIFHKDSLRDPGRPGLSSGVRDVVANSAHKVVSVVINVVDDQLSSNDQLSGQWREASLPLVDQVLVAAREAGRVVLLTSDHGHVRAFDSSTKGKINDEPQDGRFKSGNDSVEEGEVLVSGTRVVHPDHKIIAPWSEAIRYAHPKKGYHGGVSLQEIVIPFAVYASAGLDLQIDEWAAATQSPPAWWAPESSHVNTMLVAEDVMSVTTNIKVVEKGQTEDLFDNVEAPQDASQNGWLDTLLQSPVLAAQRQRAARANIDDALLQSLLECLTERGDQAGTQEIAKATGKTLHRVPGFIANARKILNVDGYDILSVEIESGTVRLNRQQLKNQFGLDT